jgi:CheY-like chemotaxis protein
VTFPNTEDGSSDPLRGLHILLVDDHPAMLFALGRLLSLSGAAITSARNGADGIQIAATQAFDLVLMDINMPGMGGLEATRVLRASGTRIPILAITADPSDDDRAQARAAGCDHMLAKPFGLDELTSAFHRAREARLTAT